MQADTTDWAERRTSKRRRRLYTRQNKKPETLYEAKQEAVNPNDTVCPIEGCGYVFSLVNTNKSRRFNITTKQWICPSCLYFAGTNDGIPSPVTKPRTSHDPTKVDLVCQVSWCTTLMQKDQGLVRHMWHAGLELWVCSKCFELSTETCMGESV